MNTEKYRAKLTAMLGEKRLSHSENVCTRAIELADKHGADRDKAALAGLLHDICRDMPPEEQLKYLAAHGILLDRITRQYPALWHAPCGAVYLEQELGIADEDVLNAVRYHTTGRAGMTVLEQVVFLADATAAERNYPGVDEQRALTEKSLPAAMREALRYELARQIEKGQPVVTDAWQAYNFFAQHSTIKTDNTVNTDLL